MELEEIYEAVGMMGILVAIVNAVYVSVLNMGQLVGSMPCRRIALVGRKSRIKVHRKGARSAGLPMVQVRMTAPNIRGWKACLFTPEKALVLADILDEAVRKVDALKAYPR
jgi:hypothetical protein